MAKRPKGSMFAKTAHAASEKAIGVPYLNAIQEGKQVVRNSSHSDLSNAGGYSSNGQTVLKKRKQNIQESVEKGRLTG